MVSGGILVAMAVAVGVLRFHRQSELLPGSEPKLAANGLDAFRVLQGEHAVIFPQKLAGLEETRVYAIASAFAPIG